MTSQIYEFSYDADTFTLLRLADYWQPEALQKRLKEVDGKFSRGSAELAHAYCDTIFNILNNSAEKINFSIATDIYNQGFQNKVFDLNQTTENSCLEKIEWVSRFLKDFETRIPKEVAYQNFLEGTQTSMDCYGLIETLLTDPFDDIYLRKAVAIFYQAIQTNIWSEDEESLAYRADSLSLLKEFCTQDEFNRLKENIYEHFLICDEEVVDPETRAARYCALVLMHEEDFIESDQEFPLKIYNQGNIAGVWSKNSITREYRKTAFDSLTQCNFPKIFTPDIQDSIDILLENEHRSLEPEVKANGYYMLIQQILDCYRYFESLNLVDNNPYESTVAWYKDVAVSFYNRGFKIGVWLANEQAQDLHLAALKILQNNLCEKIIELETENCYQDFLEKDGRNLYGEERARVYSDTINMLLYDCQNLNFDEETSQFYKKRAKELYSKASREKIWDTDTTFSYALNAVILLM